MNTWFRKVGMGACALTLAGVLGGCNNGDGGLGGLLLYFGINGSGDCDLVVVTVDLDEANAVIARDDNGDVQCELDEDLVDDECDIEFEETGGLLVATLSGCEINGVENLFNCLFVDVDISDLNSEASATCDCIQSSGCDGTPPVCISPIRDPRSCEDCDNERDDDGDGDIDCDDEDCSNFPGCEDTTTSTTSTTSTTTTSTTNSTTTTTTSTTSTTGEPPLTCTITFRLDNEVTLGALQWLTDYSDAPGNLSGTAGDVQCSSLVEQGLPAFNDCDAANNEPSCTNELQETLNAGIIKLSPGFTGPTDVAECIFNAFTPPQESDFDITVTEATTPGGVGVAPLPTMSISSIDCDELPPTTTLPGSTTTTVPTTTLPPPTTTLPPGGDTYSVTFRLLTASATVGALQLEADYSAAPGGFRGVGEEVVCTSTQALPAFFDQDGNDPPDDPAEILNLGYIALSAFAAPTDLATCTFDATPGEVPVAGDFVITLIDATNGTGQPLTGVTFGVTVTPIP